LYGPGPERVGFSVSIRDITERKQAEAEAARLLAEVRKQERWQAANADIRLSVVSAESLDATLSMVCDRACDLAESAVAMVILSGDDGRVAAASLGAHDLIGTPVEGFPTSLTAAMEAAAPPVVQQPLGLPPAVEVAVGPSPIVSVIVAAGSAVGVLIVSAPADPQPHPAPRVMVDSLANQAALALELDRARRDSERLLLAEDRDRIARDLHDVVIQRLFASGMSLQGVLSLISDERAATRISNVVDNLDATISEIRTAIFALGEVRGDDRVRADVLALTRRAAEQLGFTPSVRFEGAVETTIPTETAAHVLAVLTEALSNVVRHARASSVAVRLSAGREVVLEVDDDGVGLGTPERQSGLANMRRRAEGLGGTLTIDSTPGAGTRLVWRVPRHG
jgi:signal transduction histidine kinase